MTVRKDPVETTLKPTVMKWLEALRSGKYKQGKYFLKEGDGYCCLGVACAVHNEAVPKNNRVKETVKYGEGDVTVMEFGGSADFLPERVANYFGISGTLEEKVCRMNDRGRPFSQIADYIEEQFNKGK